MDHASARIVVSAIADLVLIAQIFIVFFAILLFLRKLNKKNKTMNNIVQLFSDNALIFSFFIALFAMSGSLFFSEIAHFVPCKLCWYQRICMYPQVLLLGIANLKNDWGIKRYVLPLSIVGIVIATYHYILQMSPIPLPCSDEVANCALKQVASFGYITIPLMSFTAFALIILMMLQIKKK
ncbi:MAG TPA: disulfide bond formation protein B [Patescibacteria group bacterium]|nr:disulfide bond formation protein B [Patescibacteria group bacterium]